MINTITNNTDLEQGHGCIKNFQVAQLKLKWDKIYKEDNVFRYKIDKLRVRYVGNQYLLQLNIDRGIKRRLPEEISTIHQPYNHNKFNFTKVSPTEVLFNIFSDGGKLDKHTLLVNVSPITHYHSLLCPSINKCLPQAVTLDSLRVALKVILHSEDRSLRIGFNSLCAFASVNHLHYHIIFEHNQLPIETAKCRHIKGPLYCLTNDYPIPGFCFEVSTEDSMQLLSVHAYTLLNYLLSRAIAHNIFMTRGQSMTTEGEVVRIVVWPRKNTTGIKEFTAFNVAAFELSGSIVVYSSEDFEGLQKEDIDKELVKWRLDDFQELCDKVKLLF